MAPLPLPIMVHTASQGMQTDTIESQNPPEFNNCEMITDQRVQTDTMQPHNLPEFNTETTTNGINTNTTEMRYDNEHQGMAYQEMADQEMADQEMVDQEMADQEMAVVLATGRGNLPAVRVWTTKTGRFSSRTVQKHDPQTLGGPNLDPYPSTHGFRRVWLDLSVPISGSAFRVSHIWSHSDMRMLIVKY